MPLPEDLLRRNRLLAAAPPSAAERIAEVGSYERLEFKAGVFEPDTKGERVVFPIVGVCSLLTVLDEERVIEVATIGNEGFVGLPVFRRPRSPAPIGRSRRSRARRSSS